MANRKVPNHLKVVRGTDQPVRMQALEIEFEPLAEAPVAPDWLDILAKKYWDRIVPVLMAKKVLSEADLEALSVLCALYGKVRQAYTAGVDLSASLITQLRLYQTEFGLTPVSRSKITKSGEDAKDNPFKKPAPGKVS